MGKILLLAFTRANLRYWLTFFDRYAIIQTDKACPEARMKRVFFLIFIFLFTWTACSADTLSGDGFRIEYTTPEGWLSSTQHSTAELEEKLGLAEGALAVISELPGTTKLYYPVDGTYLPDNSIRLTVSPMESYHKNYSGFDEAQLGNIANSFMRDGKMDAYHIIKTAGGLTFLQLRHTSGTYEYTFTTNENGTIFRAEVPASADMEQVMQWLESISISIQSNRLLDLVIQHWYYAFVFVIIIAGIIMRNKKPVSSQ